MILSGCDLFGLHQNTRWYVHFTYDLIHLLKYEKKKEKKTKTTT